MIVQVPVTSNIYRMLLILITVIWVIPRQGSGQQFEGVVRYNIPELEREIGTTQLDYMVKGGMVRIEYLSGRDQTTSILYDSESRTMYIKISMLAGHVEVPPDDVKQGLEKKEVTFTQTDETQSIAGRSCTIWETTFDGRQYRYCFVPEMANFILPINSVTAGNIPVWAAVQIPELYLPLQVTRIGKGNKEQVLMKATGIEERELDRNLFSVFQ